jgi:hypothetical protein
MDDIPESMRGVRFDELVRFLRNWRTIRGGPEHDVSGMAQLMCACIDNMRQFGLDAELEDVAGSFAPEHSAFILKLAYLIKKVRPKDS